MPTYFVNWCKTYNRTGTEVVQAPNRELAEATLYNNIGDLEGSLQYMADHDEVEVDEETDTKPTLVHPAGDGVFDAKIQETLKQGGGECPACGNHNTTVTHSGMDSGKVYKNVICDDCQQNWQEEFGLTSIKINNVRYNSDGSKEEELC